LYDGSYFYRTISHGVIFPNQINFMTCGCSISKKKHVKKYIYIKRCANVFDFWHALEIYGTSRKCTVSALMRETIFVWDKMLTQFFSFCFVLDVNVKNCRCSYYCSHTFVCYFALKPDCTNTWASIIWFSLSRIVSSLYISRSRERACCKNNIMRARDWHKMVKK
jgi:hypothetical protein